MKYSLNIAERLTILQIIPNESNFLTLKVLRILTDDIGIKEEEFKKYNLTQANGQIKWDKSGNEEVEFEIGERATEIIIESLQKLDKSNKLEQRHFTLYTKFLGE